MQQNLDESKKYIQAIINQISRKQISELLTNWFEISKMPEVIAMARKRTSVSGYAKIDKKIFQFSIIFLTNEDKLTMAIDLNLSKNGITKTKEIGIKKDKSDIYVFLVENRQYLFSVST